MGMRTPRGTRNGVYDLTLNSAAVTSEANPGVPAQPHNTDTFYRFGDAQGTGRVDGADYNAFQSTYNRKSTDPAYLAYFADDGTNKIDTADYNAFLNNYGKRLTGLLSFNPAALEPTSVAATVNGSTSVTISWTAPANAVVTSYSIQRWSAADQEWGSLEGDANLNGDNRRRLHQARSPGKSRAACRLGLRNCDVRASTSEEQERHRIVSRAPVLHPIPHPNRHRTGNCGPPAKAAMHEERDGQELRIHAILSDHVSVPQRFGRESEMVGTRKGNFFFPASRPQFVISVGGWLEGMGAAEDMMCRVAGAMQAVEEYEYEYE